MKQFFTILTLFLMSLTINAQNSGKCGSNLTWSYDSDSKTLTISGTGEMDNYERDFLTFTYNTPWYGQSDLIEKLVIGNEVNRIGVNAFAELTSLTSIEFEAESSLESIGIDAFFKCFALHSITIPKSVVSIGEGAFGRCFFLNGSFVCPDGLDANGHYHWGATICDSILNGLCIRDNSVLFYDGTGSSVTIPATVTTITQFAFADCRKLETVAFAPDCKLATIEELAFENCTGLTSFTIPASVTEIGYGAFLDCSNLVSVASLAITPPRLAVSEGDDGWYFHFKGCSALEAIYVPAISINTYKKADGWKDYADKIQAIPGSVCPDNQIWYTAKVKLAEYPSNNYVGIKTDAFNVPIAENGHTWDPETGIGVIVFDGTLTSIGDEAFFGCQEMETITIPENVASIGKFAFNDCKKLKSIEFPASVKSIGQQSFDHCITLDSISIPSSLTDIGLAAFHCCSELKSITVEAGNPKYDSRNNCNAIIDSETNELLAGCKNTIIPDGVTKIGCGAFSLRNNLISITIPNSVTCIAEEAFNECYDLKSITLSSNLTEIENSAFYFCNNLTSVILPESLTKIGEFAFQQCASLSSIISLPTTPPELGRYVFANINKNACTLIVKEESMEAYKTADQWKDFTDIRKFDPTSIENVQGSDFNIQSEVYNLAGQIVDENYKGIVIVNGKKVLNK